MKLAFAALAVLLSSFVSAQTSAPVISYSFQQRYVTAFVPCLNHGKGESVTFTNKQEMVFYYTVTNGKRTGFFMFTGIDLFGRGQTTGIQYGARGSDQYSFSNWLPFNPDGSADGEGSFTITDNYYVYATSSTSNENHIWHRTQRFTNTKHPDGTITSQDQPDEVTCQ